MDLLKMILFSQLGFIEKGGNIYLSAKRTESTGIGPIDIIWLFNLGKITEFNHSTFSMTSII